MEKLVVYTNPTSPVTEAYRMLGTNLLAGLGKRKLIEMVGITTNTNTNVVVANLATAIAQAGKRVLLIDCNLRDPKQHELFGLQNCGLVDALNMADDLSNFAQQTAQQNLQVLTAGTFVPNPVEVLMSSAMQKVLDIARETYDLILIDVPVVAAGADAVALGTIVDGVLLIFTNKEDKVKQAQSAKVAFTQACVPILGCVLDKA